MESKKLAQNAWGQITMLLVGLGFLGGALSQAIVWLKPDAPIGTICFFLSISVFAVGIIAILIALREKWTNDELKDTEKEYKKLLRHWEDHHRAEMEKILKHVGVSQNASITLSEVHAIAQESKTRIPESIKELRDRGDEKGKY